MPKHWDKYSSFNEAKKAWEEKEKELQKTHPLKTLKTLPNMPGIVKKDGRFLKLKTLYYLLKEDKNRIFLRYFFKKPFLYSFSLIRSYLKKNSFRREGDFFLYGIKSIEDFEKKLSDKNAFLVLGFSYCHKPFECPSGRFTDQCIHDPKHPVCGQCFIGKSIHALEEKNSRHVLIPTIHYIGEKIFETIKENPDKKIIFIITACEMTLTMFADWGNMVGIQGIGVRLDGRICNTMKAFDLSEKGIKPGLTVVLDETQQKILDLLAARRTL